MALTVAACWLLSACTQLDLDAQQPTAAGRPVQSMTQAPAPVQSLEQVLGPAIGAAVRAQIDAKALPGAVVVIGDANGILFRQAYGRRALEPQAETMTADTVFDLASLTKAVATTTAVMQLVERRLIELDAPVQRYWPAFKGRGKGDITVAQLLAHTSGLRPDLDTSPPWSGQEAGLNKVLNEATQSLPGIRMVYSDINFIVLGELVRRLSDQALPDYASTHIFKPLGMVDTGFLPDVDKLRKRIAPTEQLADGTMLRGAVHDPTARRMGGWAGHAGLFGTADDLARFAQAMLRDAEGRTTPPALLRADTLATMMQPASPRQQADWRGLGWALDAPLAPGRESLAPVGLIGHTGYTGTGLWIDLLHRQYLIILSNRVHPRGLGDARPLRRQVIALMASQHAPVSAEQLNQRWPAMSEVIAAGPPPPAAAGPATVMSGIDVLRTEGYARLKGQRVGLITNLSAVDAQGWRTLDRLRHAPGVSLRKVFTPEHGLNRDQEGQVASGIDPSSGLPLISLYGKRLRPTPDMLDGLDTLVFDMQDAGVRFYTYLSTMGEAMQAAAQAGLGFIVLDRPNPIGADRVAGPMLDADLRSFTAYSELPVQHGMTLGEMARWLQADIQARTGLLVKLQVVPMRNHARAMRFEQTGLDWVPPSPNLRTPLTALLYPGVAWVEGANVSVGRGTDRPFEWVGAPWIDGRKLADAMQADALPGVVVTPVAFTPDSGPYQGQVCQGVQFKVTQRDAFDAQRLGLSLTRSLQLLWPGTFQLDKTLGMIGSRDTLARLRALQALDEIIASWQPGWRDFLARRAAYLLY